MFLVVQFRSIGANGSRLGEVGDLDPDAAPEIIHFEGVIKFAEGCFYVKAYNGQCIFLFSYDDYEIEVIGHEF